MKPPRKLVCVVGLGQFGSELARELARSADVLALDVAPERVNALSEDVQRAVCLDARDAAALASLVHAGFDVGVVSIGRSLEASILATLHLARIGVKQIHAKAQNDDHATILRAVGATGIVFADREMARRLADRIEHPNLLDHVPLEGDYRVMEMEAPLLLDGRTLLDLQLRPRFGVFVIAVKRRAPDEYRFLPGPDFAFRVGDTLVVIGPEADLRRLRTAGDELVPS